MLLTLKKLRLVFSYLLIVYFSMCFVISDDFCIILAMFKFVNNFLKIFLKSFKGYVFPKLAVFSSISCDVDKSYINMIYDKSQQKMLLYYFDKGVNKKSLTNAHNMPVTHLLARYACIIRTKSGI